jgi:hypothetical protein
MELSPIIMMMPGLASGRGRSGFGTRIRAPGHRHRDGDRRAVPSRSSMTRTTGTGPPGPGTGGRLSGYPMTCLWQWASGWLGRGTPRPADRAADSARRPGAGGGGLGCSGRGSGSEVLRLAGCPGQSSRHGPTAPTPGRQAEPEPRDRRTSLGECHGIIQVGSIIESAGRPPGPEARAASESEDRTQDCQRIGPPAPGPRSRASPSQSSSSVSSDSAARAARRASSPSPLRLRPRPARVPRSGRLGWAPGLRRAGVGGGTLT